MNTDKVVLNNTTPPVVPFDLYPTEVAYCLYMPVVKPNTPAEIAEVVRVLRAGGECRVTLLTGNMAPWLVSGSDAFVNFGRYRYDPISKEFEAVVLLREADGKVIDVMTGRVMEALPITYYASQGLEVKKAKVIYDP